MPEYAEFIGAVRDFLQRQNPACPDSFGPDENLFALGLVDSLRLVELIVHIEGLTGQEIPVEDFSIKSFYTLDSLYQMACHVTGKLGSKL